MTIQNKMYKISKTFLIKVQRYLNIYSSPEKSFAKIFLESWEIKRDNFETLTKKLSKKPIILFYQKGIF